MQLIDKLAAEDAEIFDSQNLLKRLCSLKHKEVLRDTLSEYQRKGNFVRLYPSKGSDVYDVYFASARPLNRFLYRVLYTDDVMPYKNRETPKLNYKLDMPQSYDYYKKKTMDQKQIASSGDLKEDEKESEPEKESEKQSAKCSVKALLPAESREKVSGTTQSTTSVTSAS